jgi:predicted Zn-dependent protease
MSDLKNRFGSVAGLAVLVASFALVTLGGMNGCSTVSKVGTQIAQDKGVITEEQAGSINRTAEAVEKSYQDITPEEEYYIGRAVAATILDRYKPYEDPAATRYLNLLGQTLALASSRPETFGGYHFLILDTEEINAFAAPGGLIMISRGMIRCCQGEDELAAVLAHEIGHVAHKDGLRAIKKSRLTSALTIIATEGAKNLGGEELAKLTEEFEGSIADITATLVNSGYARGLEKEADAAAIATMRQVGYNPRGLVAMLQEMKKRLKPGGLDFAKTHPDPGDRIADIQGKLTAASVLSEPQARQQRFAAAVGSV